MTTIAIHRRRHWRVLIGVAAFCLFGTARSGTAAEAKEKKSAPETFTLGLVSEVNRSAIEAHFADFAAYVARKLSGATKTQGKVVVAASPTAMVKLLEQKAVDYYFESPYATYVINDVYGAGRARLRRWKGGLAEYQSLIFSGRKGGIGRLQDLRGKTIVFEDPGSTSGYLLPKFFLLRNGFKLVENARPDPQAPAEAVRYIFAYSQEKLIDLVAKEAGQAGAFSNQDYADLDERKKADFTVLAQTERLPRHLVSIRTDLAPELAERLEKVLLGMDGDEEGRRILNQTDHTTKFDMLPGGEEGMRRRLLETFLAPEK